MAHFTLAASGIIIDAFQWNGGNLSSYTLPYWALNLSLETPGDDTLGVPMVGISNLHALPTDWVLSGPFGYRVMSNLMFTSLFTATA